MRRIFLALFYRGLMRGFLKFILGIQFYNDKVLKEIPQFIIVANHNSHVDTMVLMSAVPSKIIDKVHPVAAIDYFGGTKIKSFFTKYFINAILIPRTTEAGGIRGLHLMMEQLDKGHSIILFPEGSRGEPEKVQKFKRGIGFILERYPHIPYIPVFMKGMGKIMPKGDNVVVPFNSYAIFGAPVYCRGKSKDDIVNEIETTIISMQQW